MKKLSAYAYLLWSDWRLEFEITNSTMGGCDDYNQLHNNNEYVGFMLPEIESSMAGEVFYKIACSLVVLFSN